jgi:hypothetical protein
MCNISADVLFSLEMFAGGYDLLLGEGSTSVFSNTVGWKICRIEPSPTHLVGVPRIAEVFVPPLFALLCHVETSWLLVAGKKSNEATLREPQFPCCCLVGFTFNPITFIKAHIIRISYS